MEYDVPSVSPGIGMRLLDVEKAVLAIPVSVWSAELQAYANALRLICNVAAGHQKAVIDTLEAILKRDGYSPAEPER